MATEHKIDIELLSQQARRQLWAALALVLILGTATLAALAFPTARGLGGATALWTALPVLIVIGIAAVHRTSHGSAAARRALHDLGNDELRRHSMQLAWRNGFFAMLAVQVPFALAASGLNVSNGIAVMAAATVMTGVAGMLASLLWHDR